VSRKLLLKLSLAGIGLCLMLIGASFLVDLSRFTPTGGLDQAINPSGDFTLVEDDSRVFHLSDLRGDIVLLFFGYASCPDACPSTLAKIQRTLRLLGPEQGQVRTVFVSVDPERDTPARLKEYLDYFGINGVGLTGTREQIDTVVDAYHAYYLKIPGQSADWYTFNHSTTVYLHDKRGRVRQLFKDEDTPEQMAAAIRQFL
jgi:protein SCO1/2